MIVESTPSRRAPGASFATANRTVVRRAHANRRIMVRDQCEPAIRASEALCAAHYDDSLCLIDSD